MDIIKFQEKLTEICKLGEKNGKKLKPEQIKKCFEGMELERSQLVKILQYLKSQGITIEGTQPVDEKEGQEPGGQTEEVNPRVPLSPEEEAYLKEYLSAAKENQTEEFSREELFDRLAQGDISAREALSQMYLGTAAQMAAEMKCEEIYLADLIQEANVSLLMALQEEKPAHKDEKWLMGRIRAGIRQAIEKQTQRKFEDDYLVSKVEKLESAVRELTEGEDGEESRFTVEELSVLLDMSVEEIRDVLRLTGDDK
ncbi:MAG: hypothetical protein SO401_10510 [Blautia sp.]|nr:hypothetical protein [Blautia sp.]